MKNLFLVLLLALSSFGVHAQVGQPVSVASSGVEEIYLAKDEAGRTGETVESFLTGDIPIHCVVRLDSAKTANVKMNFVAEKVAGVKPETKVISVSYQTDGKQNQVNFTGRPDGFWIAGNYRIDIYIDDAAAASKRFQIKKLTGAAEKPPLERLKNFAPAKSKIVRRPRKS